MEAGQSASICFFSFLSQYFTFDNGFTDSHVAYTKTGGLSIHLITLNITPSFIPLFNSKEPLSCVLNSLSDIIFQFNKRIRFTVPATPIRCFFNYKEEVDVSVINRKLVTLSALNILQWHSCHKIFDLKTFQNNLRYFCIFQDNQEVTSRTFPRHATVSV